MALQQYIVRTPDGQQQTVSVDLEAQGLTPEAYADRLRQVGIQFVGRGAAAPTPQMATPDPQTLPQSSPQMASVDPRPSPGDTGSFNPLTPPPSVGGRDIFGSMAANPTPPPGQGAGTLPPPTTGGFFGFPAPTPPPLASAPPPPITPGPAGAPPPLGNPSPPPIEPPPPVVTAPPSTPAPPPGSSTTTVYNPALPQGPTVSGPGGLEYQGARGEGGQLLDPFDIPSIVLPGAPNIGSTLDQGAQDRFTGLMNNIAGQVQQQYAYQNPAFTAAEMQRGDIPQAQAQQFGTSPELQQMISGQGFNPSILAQMRSRASEGVNQAGLSEMSQTKRALEQAGLGGSPAGAAVAGDVARRSGQARSSALRDVDIANAEQGIENAQFGIGQQTNIGLSNMQQANQMAMQNANMIFSGLSQNLANVQQARGAQFGAEVDRQGRQADATSNILGQQSGIWQTAAANTAQNAPFQNAQNTLTRDWNQAQLERQRQQTNLGTRESRWQTAVTGLPGFSPLPNPNFQNYQGYSPFGG